jgi:hypothetical protein
VSEQCETCVFFARTVGFAVVGQPNVLAPRGELPPRVEPGERGQPDDRNLLPDLIVLRW